MPHSDRDEIGRRIAAARSIAGLSQRDMGKCLADNPNYGETLSQAGVSRLERGQLHVRRRDWTPLLRAIAEVCGVPMSWFYADFSRLDEIAPATPEESKASFARALHSRAQPTSSTPEADRESTPDRGGRETAN